MLPHPATAPDDCAGLKGTRGYASARMQVDDQLSSFEPRGQAALIPVSPAVGKNVDTAFPIRASA